MKTLILTDHRGHSDQNSLYALARSLAAHPASEVVHVASRGDERNTTFFQGAYSASSIEPGPQVQGLVEVQSGFGYAADGRSFLSSTLSADPATYDLLWLRLPPPADGGLFAYLESLGGPTIVNHPAGIVETGSKAFLLNFPQWTAPTRLIRSAEDLLTFANQFPLVLKPLRDYGGRGLVSIQGGRALEGDTETALEDFITSNQQRLKAGDYLAMKFLKNVTAGDKRILVAGDQILGASLRLPAPGQWLCNVSMGGTSVAASVTERERAIVAAVAPELNRRGVLFFGVDTLEDDDGQRVLSELNTNSIGGFPQAEAQSGQPVVRRAIDALVAYVNQQA